MALLGVRDMHAVRVDLVESTLSHCESLHWKIGVEDCPRTRKVAIYKLQVYLAKTVCEDHKVNSRRLGADRSEVKTDEGAVNEPYRDISCNLHAY